MREVESAKKNNNPHLKLAVDKHKIVNNEKTGQFVYPTYPKTRKQELMKSFLRGTQASPMNSPGVW